MPGICAGEYSALCVVRPRVRVLALNGAAQVECTSKRRRWYCQATEHWHPRFKDMLRFSMKALLCFSAYLFLSLSLSLWFLVALPSFFLDSKDSPAGTWYLTDFRNKLRLLTNSFPRSRFLSLLPRVFFSRARTWLEFNIQPLWIAG